MPRTEYPTTYLADLLDDLNAYELAALLNWLAVNGYVASRANIGYWRTHNHVPDADGE